MLEFDLIGDVGVHITGLGVSQNLQQANGEDVNFNIATYGGDLEQSKIIRNKFKGYSGKVYGTLIGNTASAGTVMLMGCDVKRAANKYINFLVHNSIDPKGGNAEELKKKIAGLNREDAAMTAIYMEETGLPEATIRDLMLKGDWISTADATKYGFIDEVIDSGLKAVAYHSNIKLSEDLLIKLNNKMNLPWTNKSKGAAQVHLITLAGGQKILASAEVIAEGVEVAPVGAEALPPGTYKLEDGTEFTVDESGMTTKAVEPQAAAKDDDEEKVIDTVAQMLVASEAKIEAMIEAKMKPLQTLVSSHQPAQGVGVDNGTLAFTGEGMQATIEARKAEIKEANTKKRRGV